MSSTMTRTIDQHLIGGIKTFVKFHLIHGMVSTFHAWLAQAVYIVAVTVPSPETVTVSCLLSLSFYHYIILITCVITARALISM